MYRFAALTGLLVLTAVASSAADRSSDEKRPAKVDDAKLFVVCVGIDRAAKKESNDMCVQDAEDVAKLFEKKAPYSAVEAKVLTRDDTTHKKIHGALAEAGKAATEKDVVLVYVYCHGGATWAGGYSIWNKGKPFTGADFAEAANATKAAVVIVLDTCMAEGVMNSTFTNPRVAFLCASGVNECSYGYGGHERKPLNGMFSSAVYKGLKGKADKDGDGTVILSELYEYLNTPKNVPASDTMHPRCRVPPAMAKLRLTKVK